ncbi:MAG: hypothetical protein IT260_23765 [Saprospiraceae bacterium]|nr:hypothetical protein [Saprospiraceae bacterium]
MKQQPALPNFVSTTATWGTVVYLALATLATVFYLERMAFLDMAFQCFHILRTGELQIQSGRFGAAGTQVFAWLAQAAGLPLRGVLLSYSLGHVLYYLILFLLITLGLRQWKWGLVLVLVSTLMTTHTFYWLSEMPQGLAFLLLVLAWLQHKGSLDALRWWEYPLLAAALVTAFYFHPMVLYAMVFCSVFFLLDRQSSKGTRALQALALGIFVATVFVKYKVLKLDWYDAMSLERAKAFGELWPNWFDIPSNRDFLRWCLRDYYLIPVLVAANTIFYLRQKNWLKAGLCAAFPLGFVLMVNIPFHQGDNQFYLENLYLPLAVFAALPFVFDVVPALPAPRWQWGALSALVLISLFRIFQTHDPWTARLRWEQELLQQTSQRPARKLLLTEQQAPMDKLVLSWGTPYEFLMLSALGHPDSARCILVDEAPERFDTLLAKPGLFLGEFKNYRFDELPQRYFHLTDTSAYVRY